MGAYPPPPNPLGSAWPLKPDPGLDAARREAEERERERQRRDREERERKEREREEKMKREREEREQREREQRERERERERDRERKERERRDMERREIMERERLVQQQRLNDNSKAARDRSPLRNGENDIRVKEEPRKDDAEMMMRAAADQRYHQTIAAWQMSGRHPHMLAPPHMSRGSILPPSSMVGLSHYPQAPQGWPALDPYRDPYRLMDPMLSMNRTYPMNPMLDAMRVEEAKAYAAASAHYRIKDQSPIPQMGGHPPSVPSPHHRMSGQLKPSIGQIPTSSSGGLSLQNATNDLHKKEDTR